MKRTQAMLDLLAAPLLRRLTLMLAIGAVAVVSLAPAASHARSKKKVVKQYIILDGMQERVNWNDGDSFRVLDGPRKGQKARLRGYNTLESYGPVHFWGDAHGWDLYRTHKKGTAMAKSQEWECESNGEADGYGRILVDCPDLRKALVAAGFAHVYAYGDEVADPALVAVQLKAQAERVGMWARGIPRAIVTSVHSVDEVKEGEPLRQSSYNRLCDTLTGKTFTVKHTSTFKACDAFCHSGSCMLYIPFTVRYGDKRPDCVKGDNGERNRMTAPAHLHQPVDRSKGWK